LEKEFVKKRFALTDDNQPAKTKPVQKLNKPELFSIRKTLKQKFPSISIGIAIIKNVTIEKSNHQLEKEKQNLLSSLEGLTTEQIGQYAEIISYRKLYKETGIDWHSRRPSPEALLRRVALKKGLYAINTCVDAYNQVVMKNRVSVGAFDLDKINFPTELRFAKAGEEILLLGDSEPTKYKKGEIAYFDTVGGFNIDFNYRDAQRTSVNLDTKNLYINVDGVHEITPEQVENTLREACDFIIKYCGGKLETFGLVYS
jgi:DNA/RNA-binding domain of Phe-tRNA-synthetase-like protein